MTSLGSLAVFAALVAVPWSSHAFLFSSRFSSHRFIASSRVVYVQTQADLSLIALERLVFPPFLKGFLFACILLTTFASTRRSHQHMFVRLQLWGSIVTRHQVSIPSQFFSCSIWSLNSSTLVMVDLKDWSWRSTPSTFPFSMIPSLLCLVKLSICGCDVRFASSFSIVWLV